MASGRVGRGHQRGALSATTNDSHCAFARGYEDIGQPNLPFIIGEVYDNGHRDSVLTAQRAVAVSVANVGLAPANALKTSDNGTHFDTASQLTLGERFAAAMLKLMPK